MSMNDEVNSSQNSKEDVGTDDLELPTIDTLLKCGGCNVLMHISCFGKERSKQFNMGKQ